MPTPTAAPPPTHTCPRPAAAAIDGDNLAPINAGTTSTTVLWQITGYDAEKTVALWRAVLQATVQAAPVDPQRNAELVAYYTASARTLEGAAEEVREGSVSLGGRGALRGNAEHLSIVAGDVIGPHMASAISAKVLECYAVERFGTWFMNLPPAGRDEKFAVLDDAAGNLRAAGQPLRVRQ